MLLEKRYAFKKRQHRAAVNKPWLWERISASVSKDYYSYTLLKDIPSEGWSLKGINPFDVHDYEGNFHKVGEALNEAEKSFRGLRQNWDEEEGPIADEETILRASAFLQQHCKYMVQNYALSTPVPKILPGPSGSIDLLWQSDEYELLLNIPRDAGSKATFYGDDRGEVSIKGKIDLTKINHGLVQWLMSHQAT